MLMVSLFRTTKISRSKLISNFSINNICTVLYYKHCSLLTKGPCLMTRARPYTLLVQKPYVKMANYVMTKTLSISLLHQGHTDHAIKSIIFPNIRNVFDHHDSSKLDGIETPTFEVIFHR